jgi:hypothetical protein
MIVGFCNESKDSKQNLAEWVVASIGSKDSASARASELPRMGAKIASMLGCGPDWEQRETGRVKGLGSCLQIGWLS